MKSQLEQLGDMYEKAAIEAIGQLTRFVYRKAISPEEAAKLSLEIATAFANEIAIKLNKANDE